MKRTIRICDRHDADANADETIMFRTADGEYEIDLCPEHIAEWQRLQEELGGWVSVARATSPAEPPEKKPRRRNADRAENAAIREWAPTIGVDIGQRGRISDELRLRYREEKANSARVRWDGEVHEHNNGDETPAPQVPAPQRAGV